MTTPTVTELRTGHVGLNVTELARSTAFYERVFGFEVQLHSEGERRYAFLARDGKLVLTLWEQSAGAFPTDRPGLHHLSFQVETLDDVRRVEATLRELGAPLRFDGVVPHREGGQSGGIFFTDPDGIRLEVFAPTGAGELPAPDPDAPTCGFF